MQHKPNIKLNHVIMLMIASDHNRQLFNFFLLLYRNRDSKNILKTRLLKQYRQITAYQKKSESETLEEFNKMFSAYQQKETLQTNKRLLSMANHQRCNIYNIITALKTQICYGNRIRIPINYKTVKKYGNCFDYFRTAIASFLKQTIEYCKDAEFDHGLIYNIFGFKRADIDRFFVRTPVIRKIGIQEAKDLNLDTNLFTKSETGGWCIQTGFRLTPKDGAEFIEFKCNRDIESMSSIVDRLEHKEYSIENGRWNRKLGDNDASCASRTYRAKRHVTGYKEGCRNSRASSFLKRVAEVTNLGQYKNCKNIRASQERYAPCSGGRLRRDILKDRMEIFCFHYQNAVDTRTLSVRF